MIAEVRKRDGSIVPFDKERIVNAIFKAAQSVGGKDRKIAERLAGEVVEILEEKCAGSVPGVEDIQDIVEKVLIEHGHAKTAKAYILYRKQKEELRKLQDAELSVVGLVDSYLNGHDWRVRENANINGQTIPGLIFHASNTVLANYALVKVYPPEVADAHANGDFHLHDLQMALCGYTYFGDEVVIARVNGDLLLLSIKQLYDMFFDEQTVSDGVFTKDVRNLNVEVLDKDGFTKVHFITKKEKDRPMLFLKTEDGKSCIVTDNHPVITERGNILARDVEENETKLTTVELLATIDGLFAKTELYISDELAKAGILNFKVDGVDGSVIYLSPHLKNKPINKDSYIVPSGPAAVTRIWSSGYWWVRQPKSLKKLHEEKLYSPLKNKLSLDKDFGYLVGLFVAEGNYTNGGIFLSQKREEIRKKIIEILNKLGWSYTAVEKGVLVHSRIVKNLFETVFGIRPYSKNINLPIQCLQFSLDFNKGMIAGIIDGDGSARNNQITIHVASRALCNQLHILLSHLGLNPRDMDLQGVGSTRFFKGKKIVQRYPLYGISFSKSAEVDLPSVVYSSLKPARRDYKRRVPGLVTVIKKKATTIADKYIYDITTESGTFVCNGIISHNCAGWSLEQLLLEGFNAPGRMHCNPPKHLDTALMQMVNYIGTLQNEWAGAQAFNHIDILLAPFVRADKLSYEEVKQALQMFVFNLNISSRWGSQTPFTNLTFALSCPEDLANKPAVIGGKSLDRTYAEYEEEADMINRAFVEIMEEGDPKGRVFTFPIPTYSVTRDFPWDSDFSDALFRMTAKYGLPYFQNFVNSDMKPSDVRSLCCRLRLDLRELRRNVTGGLFGSSDTTGSVGVVTINMPRLGYLSKNEDEFFERLERLLYLAKESLEIKRKLVERNVQNGLLPYTKRYLGTLRNHFSTVGLVGMHEALLNMGFENGIVGEDGRKFAIRTLEFMRRKLGEYQEETGNLYNLEATPAEGTSYRLARIDKKKFPDIITAGDKEVFYTNSTCLPVNADLDLIEALEHQESLQTLYTGGTVFHTFLGERIQGAAAKLLLRKMTANTRLPYFTLTPTFSVCPDHGYLSGEHFKCPTCGGDCEVYSRVVGYYRPVKNWNAGKQEEFRLRRTFKVDIS